MTEASSRSDLQALKRSGRGKVLMLAGLLATGLGGAAWTFLGQKHGIGAPEDRTKVLVVNRGRSAGYGVMLKELGFDAAEGDLAAWERKAAESLDDVGPSDARGLALVLRLADAYGYGYVAIERPQDVDYEGVEVELQPLPDDVTFAVISVGDFGFPQRMTVHPSGSAALRDPVVPLVGALFAQDQLAEVGPQNEDPTVAVIQLRDRLGEALALLERIPRAEALVARVEHDLQKALTEKERGSSVPRVIGDVQQSASPVPLPSGEVLLVGRGFSLVTRDAVRAEVELEERERFLFAALPGGAGDVESAVCRGLLGGEISVHDSARFAYSADGGAMLVHRLSDGLSLWTAGSRGDCAFERKGTVASAGAGFEGLGVPHESGQVARAGVVGGLAVVGVHAVDGEGEQLLGMLDDHVLGEPVWWESDLLVVPGRSNAGTDGLYFMRPSAPLEVLRLDATVLPGETTLHQAAVVPGRNALIVSAGQERRRLYRIDLPAAPQALFGPDEAKLAGPPRKDGLPQVALLDTNRFVAQVLTDHGRAHDPSVSADGRWVTFGLRDEALDRDAPDDDEIAAVSTAGGSMHVLTRNALRDFSPRATADGRAVVFKTQVEIPKTRWMVTVPRSVPLPEAPEGETEAAATRLPAPPEERGAAPTGGSGVSAAAPSQGG